jgi:hypothetical protein
MKLALVALALCACREQPDPQPTIAVASYATVSTRKLDMLFQIDGTNGGELWQFGLRASFQRLIDGLSTLDGGLPDLHIGVVSSDLGTSATMGDPAPDVGSIGQGGCGGRGHDGALLTTGAPVQGTYLIDEDEGGLRRKNYTGTLADVFGQMVAPGFGDCGFEQPLAATMRAFTNDANVGFSRPDANLLVVIATDEDDCSVRDPAFFGPESGELGPLQSYRCTRFGLVCDEPLNTTGAKTNCIAREDSQYIESIAPFVERMKAVRGDPARVAVAAIAGPPVLASESSDLLSTPRGIDVELRTPPVGSDPILALGHSCMTEDAGGIHVADPGVRIAQAIDALAPNSTFDSVCTGNFDPIVDHIAQLTRSLYGITCLDPARVGAVPECNVTLESADGEAPLSLCPAAQDCFEIVEDTAACGDRPRLVVHVAAPVADQFVRARCVIANDR